MNSPQTVITPHQDAAGTWIISRYDDVMSVLCDARCVIPPIATDTGETGTLHWLRSHVARFANGPVHDRRRAVCQAELARLDIDTLRHEAYRRTAATIGAVTDPSMDVIPTVARSVPVSVLALNLGIAEAHLETVAEVATVYLQSGDSPAPRADAAVHTLVELVSGDGEETIANRIGLLVQACEATAGLIGNALALWLKSEPTGVPTTPVIPFLMETLRHDPPVRIMRRAFVASVDLSGVRIPAGTTAVLDIAAANRDQKYSPNRTSLRRSGRLYTTSDSGPAPDRVPALNMRWHWLPAWSRL